TKKIGCLTCGSALMSLTAMTKRKSGISLSPPNRAIKSYFAKSQPSATSPVRRSFIAKEAAATSLSASASRGAIWAAPLPRQKQKSLKKLTFQQKIKWYGLASSKARKEPPLNWRLLYQRYYC